MHSCQYGVTEGKEFGVDDGEHGLTAAMAVPQGKKQQVLETLGDVDV